MKNLLLAIPQLEVHRPPVSTAVIAGVLESHGYEIKCIDLNIELFKQLGKTEYYNLSSVWEQTRVATPKEILMLNKFIDKELIPQCDEETRILISVFTENSHVFTKLVCDKILAKYPECEIILGGMGVSAGNFGMSILEKKLCSYVIFGEGEDAIIELMKGNTDYPGINNPNNTVQVNNLDKIAFPDYSQYNFDDYDYLFENKREVNIVGSRGCVRRCTYCDVPALWPKFRYRAGQNIAEEMIKNYEKFGVNQFYFTDSLINGSLKAFRDMCDKLAEYNNTHKAGFNWGGQFIFKPIKQLTDDYFDMIAEAGGQQFYVGVETGSDKIRWEMDKKFTNEDIDYHLHHFYRTGMTCFFLMIIGYLTESLKDHHDNLEMYKRWQKYVATGTIAGIDLSKSLMFLDNTPLERMIDSHQVNFPSLGVDAMGNSVPNRMIWTSKLNPELTFEERMRRRLEVHEEAIKYKWPIWRGPQRLQSLYDHVLLYKKGIARHIPILSVN
jgi:hypothetical protein